MEELNEAYNYLMQIRKAESQIKRLEMKARELRSCLLPGAIRYDKDRVQSTPEDKLLEIMAEVDECERKAEAKRVEKARLVEEITGTIEMLEDENEKTVLTTFFVARESMSQAAEAISYSLRRAYYFRKQGMLHLGSMLKSANIAK